MLFNVKQELACRQLILTTVRQNKFTVMALASLGWNCCVCVRACVRLSGQHVPSLDLGWECCCRETCHTAPHSIESVNNSVTTKRNVNFARQRSHSTLVLR